jgi:hypothetical protein
MLRPHAPQPGHPNHKPPFKSGAFLQNKGKGKRSFASVSRFQPDSRELSIGPPITHFSSFIKPPFA